MSYLVLARKYRPTTFSEVVGQEHVTRTLANAFATGRVHHAFLFCGPRGVGKTTLARILGKALNCERGPTAEPCGQCSACTSITAGNAVDYYEMDGASNRGIDSIRELTEAVRYQPAVLRKKVYVIDEVHMLTTEAFNALLKTLEEPPPHVTFVLATTEPHKLPNTILSRCQRYDFKLVPASRLAQHLTRIFAAEQISIEPGGTHLIVRESGGSVRDSLSLSDQVISYVGAAAITEVHVAEVLGVADRALTRTIVGSLATGDAKTALLAVDAASERGVDEVQIARAIVRYLRDLAVLQVAPGASELVDATDDERAELAAEAARLDRGRAAQMFDRMLRACEELGKTLQPRLVLDFALIDIAAIEPLVPLGDLLARLGELEQRLGGAPPRPRAPGPIAQVTPPGRGHPAASSPPARTPVPPPTPVPVPVPVPVPDPVVVAAPTPPPVAAPPPPDRHDLVPPDDDVPHAALTEPARRPTEPTRPPPTFSLTPDPPPPPPPRPAAAPPPLTPTPPSGPPADPIAAWSKVLATLEERRKLSLLGWYEHARVLSWTADTIELGFASEVLGLYDMAREPSELESMRQFLRDYLGRPMALSVRLLSEAESAAPASPRSILEATRERAAEERKKREAEAREHPMTKLALETFQASIKEIKTDV